MSAKRRDDDVDTGELEQAGDAPSELVTTAKTKDFTGRALVTPATVGKDYLGRLIKAGDLDYLGRALVA